MKNVLEKNEWNVFEEYLEAYLQEHPKAGEHPFLQMSGIRGIYGDKSRGLSVLYNYNMEHERLGEAYFKVYDHGEIAFAERVAELHFKDSGRECHIDPYGKKPWILNEKDIKKIRDFLEKENDEYSIEYDGWWYTNWKVLCYQWNSDNGLFSGRITDYRVNKYDDVHTYDRLKNTYVPFAQKMPDTWNCEPPKACAALKGSRLAFRGGDVVSVTENNAYPDSVYVVRETVLIDIGVATEYVYDVSPLEAEDEVYTYGKSSLELLYHDPVWEKYFNAMAGSELPVWKGELYNFNTFYEGLFHKRLNKVQMERYNADTIPPMYMRYILEKHSIYNRIDAVFYDYDEEAIIMNKLNIASYEKIHKLVISIQDKINEINKADDLLSEKERSIRSDKCRFTSEEWSLINQIDLSGLKENEKGETYTDCFRADMTNRQIMQAIKEAYHTAHKIAPRRLQRVHDRRNDVLRTKEPEKLVSPVKGEALYEGSAKNGMVIQFWYNFDLNLIEDAYPVRMHNDDKKNSTGQI